MNLGFLLQHALLVLVALSGLPLAHGLQPAVVAQVKEGQLQQLLTPAGFVWELTIPRKPDGAARYQIPATCISKVSLSAPVPTGLQVLREALVLRASCATRMRKRPSKLRMAR